MPDRERPLCHSKMNRTDLELQVCNRDKNSVNRELPIGPNTKFFADLLLPICKKNVFFADRKWIIDTFYIIIKEQMASKYCSINWINGINESNIKQIKLINNR